MDLRELLNTSKWHRKDLETLTVIILHRGAPADEKWIEGSQIVSIGRSFFSYENDYGPTEIPYHRILKVVRGAEIMFDRAQLGTNASKS